MYKLFGLSNPSCSQPIDLISSQVRVVGRVGRPTRLYSVDLAALNLLHGDRCYGSPVSLQWTCRPALLGTHSANVLLQHPASASAASSASISTIASSSTASSTAANANAMNHKQQRQSTGRQQRGVAEAKENAAYFQLGCNYSLSWEVRVVYNHQELFVRRELLTPSSAGAAARSLITSEHDGWFACSTILQDLPLKASIEVYIVCIDVTAGNDHGTSGGANKKEQYIAMESANLVLGHVPIRPSYTVGGDGDDEAAAGAGAQSCAAGAGCYELDCQLQQHPLLRGYSVLRRLRWSEQSAAATLTWQTRLVSYLGKDSSSSATLSSRSVMQAARSGASSSTAAAAGASSALDAEQEQQLPPNHQSLGYAWTVCVCGAEGAVRVVAEGRCVGAPQTEMESEVEAEAEDEPLSGPVIEDGEGSSATKRHTIGVSTSRGANSKSRLRAWLWRGCSAALTGLQVGDLVVLAARAVSEQPSYPQAVLGACAVEARHCRATSESYVTVTQQHQQQQHGAAAASDGGDGGTESTAAAAVARLTSGLFVDNMATSLYAVHDGSICHLPL